ncbi:DUF6011 domain-containing protein [Methanosarcina siciliae]|uniref:DUF6011 domain-containing protein n=1 Tax=Methanosarcina siciliae TaxID=38027 RepID=UPI00064E39EF|nr:DUF6011 domain-containing protein [Methanosarcina siciliae]
MNTCKRCNRALKDPTSIERGYGPVCYKKIQVVDDEQQEKICEPGSTIVYKGLANHTMREIRKRVMSGNIQECSCGEPLETGELRSYDHDGGYELKGFGAPQWVYLECSNCRHQLSIWKLRIDLSDLEKLKPRNGTAVLQEAV